MTEIIFEILSSAILITGLVAVMMMLIECFNVWSKGQFSGKLTKSGPVQVIVSALLGAVPGCLGGFAVVSLYTHGMISFGALLAMMIASSGDEAFVMLAMIPKSAWIIILSLTVLGIAVGLLADLVHKPADTPRQCDCADFVVHNDEGFRGVRHFGWKRILTICGVALFLFALAFGVFEEKHAEAAPEAEYLLGGINLLSEDWMNVMFAILGLVVLVFACMAGDHFVEEHLFKHIICEHLPKIFLWTAGTLSAIAVLMHYVDLSSWISDNAALMILLAAAVGIIPESGPHLIFVTMFASGIVPLPVLVASCISQDGHSCLPLIAEDRKSFLKAKLLNVVVAVAVGFGMLYLF